MNEWILPIVAFICGAAIVAVVHLIARIRSASLVSATQSRAQQLENDNARLTNEATELRRQLAEVNTQRESAEKNVAAQRERLQAYEEAEKRLTDTFKALSASALEGNTGQFIKLTEEKLKPFKELLDKQKLAVDELEKKRERAYGQIEEQIRNIASAHKELRSETGKLVTALRRPEQRGRWGEVQLRNCVEMAGLTEHCDFHVQSQTDDPETRDRPDMTVKLPGGGVIPVDAKVAWDAYEQSLADDADRPTLLRRHVEQIETHINRLASKSYWSQFEHAPKVVVMFMPLESALTAALEEKPNLHAQAMEQHVLIATPTLLVALLRAVAYGWQQEHVAANARDIALAGKDLYDRIATFVEHFEDVGKHLNRGTRAYNRAIGSLERNLLSGARKLKELHATTGDDIQSPPQIDHDVREIVSTEVKPTHKPLIEQT